MLKHSSIPLCRSIDREASGRRSTPMIQPLRSAQPELSGCSGTGRRALSRSRASMRSAKPAADARARHFPCQSPCSAHRFARPAPWSSQRSHSPARGSSPAETEGPPSPAPAWSSASTRDSSCPARTLSLRRQITIAPSRKAGRSCTGEEWALWPMGCLAVVGQQRTKWECLRNPCCGKKGTNLRLTHRLHTSAQLTRQLTDVRCRLSAGRGQSD